MREEDFFVCRCEEVSQSDILQAIEQGARTSQELKMKTRAGMGSCQGRVCRCLLESYVQEDEEKVLNELSKLTIHFPVRPVCIDQIVKRES